MAMAFQRRRLRERDAEALARYVTRLLIPIFAALLRFAGPSRWRRRGLR